MPLTKEEKKAKKEAKKLEKLKAEIEIRKNIKRDALQRELTAQAAKRGDLDRSWREMMLNIKEPLFRQDIQVMWHTFERAYDKKDHLINHIFRLMDVADDQFQRTVASFCDTIDNMINKFLADLESMSKENDVKTAALLQLGRSNVTNIMKDHDCAETHLQLLRYIAHTTSDNLAWTTRGENLVKIDEEKTKFSEIRDDLRSTLEYNYSAMWDEYKAVLKAYVVNTAENQKHVRKLRRKQNMMADIIASQGKKIANSDEMLRRLRTELAAYESGTKQAAFRDRRNRHRDACFRLKTNLYNGVETDVKLLAILVQASDDSVKWLEDAHKKGEKILRMAAICRKFETQREKVLPFGSTMPHSPTHSKSNVRRQPSDDYLVVNAISSTCGMTRLWQRISKAELSKRALYKEKNILQHENAELTRMLQYDDQDRIGDIGTFQCICGPKPSKSSLDHPTAVEGCLEKYKF